MNNNWIPVIVKCMTQNPTFFAVGAGHLGDKDGVINLLRKKDIGLQQLGSDI